MLPDRVVRDVLERFGIETEFLVTTEGLVSATPCAVAITDEKFVLICERVGAPKVIVFELSGLELVGVKQNKIFARVTFRCGRKIYGVAVKTPYSQIIRKKIGRAFLGSRP